jgi:hypothetical protein
MYAPRALAAAALVLVAFIAACPGPDPSYVMSAASASGTGGVPAATSGTSGTGALPGTTSGTGGVPGTTSGTGGVPGTTSGTGGAPTCTSSSAAQCPHASTACLTPACVGGVCAFTPAAAHTACTDDGGAVCDGNGACVGCVDNTDCKMAGDVCAMTGQLTSQCVPALANGTQCNDPTACLSGNCVDSVCCDQTCSAMCMACTAIAKGSGSDGTCGPVAFGTNPANVCSLYCNGKGACLPGKRVFVTSATFEGTFGSALEGDAKCQSVAAALGGTWMAWLSDSTTSPPARFTKSTDPYLLLDATVIAADWTALLTGTLMAPIDLDETKASVQGSAWTGTSFPGGVASSNVCLNWKGGQGALGDIGDTGATTSDWTFSGSLACSSAAHLYCFEQ